MGEGEDKLILLQTFNYQNVGGILGTSWQTHFRPVPAPAFWIHVYVQERKMELYLPITYLY